MRNKFYIWNVRRQAAQSKHVKRLKLLGRHPIVIPALTFAALVVVALGAYSIFDSNKVAASEAFIVTVSHDHEKQTVPTREPTVGSLLKKMHIKIRPGDVVEPAQSANINQDDFHINVYRGVPVEIVDGAHKTFTYSAATTPRSIVAQAGIEAYPEDELKVLPTTNFLKEDAVGERVVINRSVPVKLNLYGNELETRTHSKTIGEMLKEKNIVLEQGDHITPSPESPIKKNMQIILAHKGTKIIIKKEKIAYMVKKVKDNSLSEGTSAVRQNGEYGERVVTYVVKKDKHGKELSRQKVQTIILNRPVTEVLAVGTKRVARATGSLATWLYKLRQCESGGNYQTNTGNGYYGAYQFSATTWQRIGYSGLPSNAAPATQDEAIIKNTNMSSGGLASQNPGCYYSTGISSFPPSN